MSEQRKRKGIIRAVLAGGVVLGVGAAVTLAAWNASDFATGTFKTGTFNIEGSTDGTTYANHPSTAPATLTFDVNAANLSPGVTTYSPYAVRLTAGTTDAGTVTLLAAGQTGSLTGLTYGIVETTSMTCGASTTGTALVDPGTALGTVPATAATFPLAVGSPTTSAGAPMYLCIAVTAGTTGLTQGQTGTATWQFSAQSN